MRASKTSTSAVVGRRLRRYLAALLAVGFGAAWWSFLPPARAEVSEPPVARKTTPAPPRVARVAVVEAPVQTPTAQRIAPPSEQPVPAVHRRVKARPKKPRRKPVAPPVAPPLPEPDVIAT